MDKIVIEINGKRHLLVNDDINSFVCSVDCSLYDICMHDTNSIPCKIVHFVHGHFELENND